MVGKSYRVTMFVGAMALPFMSLPLSYGHTQEHIVQSNDSCLSLKLVTSIQQVFEELRQATALRVNGGGNDITANLAGIIKIGDFTDDVERTLVKAGFSIRLHSQIDRNGKQVDYVFALSSAVLGPKGESLGSEVTIRLQTDNKENPKRVTGLMAFITTTEL